MGFGETKSLVICTEKRKKQEIGRTYKRIIDITVFLPER